MKSRYSQQGGDLAAAKESLRHKMRRLRGTLSPERIARASRKASGHVVRVVEMRQATVVAMYAAIRGELCPAEAGQRLLDEGVTVAYPRVVGDRRVLAFHAVAGLGDLRPGRFGIPEPSPQSRELPLDAIDLFVVPGLAFDRRGRRLGWGGRYYDSTLALSRGLRVGVAYSSQLVEEVPTAEHDLSMNLLISDAGVVHTDIWAEEPDA